MFMGNYTFGRASLAELESCDDRLRQIARRVLLIKDHSIIKGHRGEQDQNQAFEAGASKLSWPNGKHNAMPSIAMDVRAWPVPDNEHALREDQLYLLGLYKGIASAMEIPLRTGGDWDRDGEIADNGFDDFFHVELDEGAV
jgi:peptidoglycan L-alanyl-D-glutamate endopeptidase CwlK